MLAPAVRNAPPRTPNAAPLPRNVAPAIQRLRLTQSAKDIAEDNQTLKEEYFAAKAAGRSIDQNDIMTLQAAQARAWKDDNERGIAQAVLTAPAAVDEPALRIRVSPARAPAVALGAGRVKSSILNKPPFNGGTPGQRYIRWKKGAEYPHTSISFRLEGKGETAQITGLHASIGATDTHFWWSHQSPAGTFHLSSQGGAKYQAADVAKFSKEGRDRVARAWAKVSAHAKKVNCTAEEPPGI
jgi:hypothetical protein